MKVVAKFGGTSLADWQNFEKAKEIVLENEACVVVPSAPGKRNSKDHKITDLLYMCFQLSEHNLNFDEVYEHIEKRFHSIVNGLNLDLDIDEILKETKEVIMTSSSREHVASRGEYMSGRVMAAYLGYNFIDAADIIKIYDGKWNREETDRLIAEILIPNLPAVVPGFYGSDKDGNIATFSRGGSDVTGSVVANGIDADLYQNWTDVPGFMVSDPKIVDNPQHIKVISYRELRELSYMGAQVLHEDAIFPLREKKIPIEIKDTNNPTENGTKIVPNGDMVSDNPVTGVAGKKDFMVITIEKTFLNEKRDFLRKMISVFETNEVRVAHMPTGIDSVSVVVPQSEMMGKESKVKEELSIYLNPDTIDISYGLALVAVVGRGMISKKGISARIFKALSDNGVNIRMITQGSSEINIIVGVENKDFENAIRSIYRAFY